MPRTAASDLASKLVGKEVRSARIDAALTQAELAARLETSSSYVANVEAGRVNVTVGQLARIADALGTDLEISLPQISVAPTRVRQPQPQGSLPSDEFPTGGPS
jgi:transcriptional regulator with XRE-family HTH domain